MRRQQQQQPPASPSWIGLNNNRSTSLPRVRLIQRRSSFQDNRQSNGDREYSGAGVRLWAKQFLSSVSPPANPSSALNTSTTITESSSSSSPSGPSVRRRTPVLTMALLKLEEQLLAYCRYLADPTFENVQSACDLLSRTIATASSPSSSNPPSPKIQSPSRSPIRSFFLSPKQHLHHLQEESSPPSSHSALALEIEWLKFTMPLFLLAGAEALYASLIHTKSFKQSQYLRSLYQRIIADLTLVKETLCDPFLNFMDQLPSDTVSSAASASPSASLTMYLERAATVAITLEHIITLAQARCRLIPLETLLFEEHAFQETSLEIKIIQQQQETATSSGVESTTNMALPMMEAFQKQLDAWKHLLDTAHFLENCRFSETILACQKTKLRLNPKSTTPMQLFLRSTLQRILKSLPVYFDRIQAFAKPLYGFSSSSKMETLDQKVREFLHKQQLSKSNHCKHTLAVCVVLDALATSNLRIERGFSLLANSAGEEDFSTKTELEIRRLQYPAVYMRTTTKDSSTAGATSSRRRSNRSAEKEDSVSSFVEPLKLWSSTCSTEASSSATAQHQTASELNVLEYTGSASAWPHSRWNYLVNLLTLPTQEEPSIALPSQNNTEPEGEQGFFNFLNNSSFSNLLDTSTRSSFMETQSSAVENKNKHCWKRSCGQTCFYITPLSDYAWVTVMVTEDSPHEKNTGWHRRKHSKLQDELEEFCIAFSNELRVSGWFALGNIQQNKALDLLLPLANYGTDQTNNWNDGQVQEFYKSLKLTFGLRSSGDRSSPVVVEPLQPSYNRGFPRFQKSPRNNNKNKTLPALSMETSASAFFLGPELMHAAMASSSGRSGNG